MRDIDFLRVVLDELDSCPYLPDQVSRLPLCLPTQSVDRSRLDQLLAAGYRRSGAFFYRTRCPNCQACEPLRVSVADFRPNRSQTRAWKRSQQHLRSVISTPEVDARRIQLFNLHRTARGLDHGNGPVGEREYCSFLLDAPCEVMELSLWQAEQLIAVSITDVGQQALSAVYCCFDPQAERFSPGTVAILTQIEIARQLGCRWLYLGMYVAANRHLSYKAGYLPHQRLQAGRWREFQRDDKKRPNSTETG